jgi:CelD/BcsL family acetyltransferase involved in cellulose biosynthesis
LPATVEVQGAIAPLADEWDELADLARASPFLRPGWFEIWWRAFGAGRLELAALRRDGRLAGVLPLARRRGMLQSLTNWHTPEFGILAEDGAARRELLERFLRGRRHPVTLRFLTAGGPDAPDAEAAARAAGRRIITRSLERSPYVPIDGDWEGYLRGRDRHRLSENRRRRRRLEERGTLSFAVEDGGERLDALLDEGLRVEASGWKGAEGTAIASRQETRQFYVEVARWAAGQGWLRLAFLRLDERAIAFQFLIVAGRVASQLKGGYDVDDRKYAPGMLLAQSVLEWVFAEGLESYEFHGVDEAFKLEWAPESRERLAVELFPRSVAGTAGWAAFAHGRPFVKRLRGLRAP